MIELKKIEGPAGIPIYYQRMPDIVESVSLTWVIFTGAADDESIGSPGLYHWFEHVPFRGTVGFPNGYADTKGLLTRYGGSNGAWTQHSATCYWACTPLEQWRESLALVTDLFARPLITDEGVSSERKVIYNEIMGERSDLEGSSSVSLAEILHRGHPFGQKVLGTEESLNAMNAETLRKAHRLGYDRSRAALFVVGNIPEDELFKEVEGLLPIIPDTGLSPRLAAADFGRCPWPKTSMVKRETAFASSMIYVMFPFDMGSSAENSRIGMILSNLFAFGSSSSPLCRIIREKYNLVYRTWVKHWYSTGGALMGFAAECKRENIDAVIDGFREVYNDPAVRSSGRVEGIKLGLKGKLKMRPIHPSGFSEQAIGRLLAAGKIVNDSDINDVLDRLTVAHVNEYFHVLDPDKACTIVFEGMG